MIADQLLASQIIEALRKGVPPQFGTKEYSVGHEQLIEGIKKYHLSQISNVGKIRFVSGSWGAGKTHFFRLLREVAYDYNCLVSNVELKLDETPLNKFERVFYTITRNITSPLQYKNGNVAESAPFGDVVYEALLKLGGQAEFESAISYQVYEKACKELMNNKVIDIDFKKIIQKYWETFLPDVTDQAFIEQTRQEILQWFAGEGTIGNFRKRFGVNKLISRGNAKQMLQSLAEFVKISGYKGLVILFDEAEQSYSVMRRSALKEAQNNLLSLINNIESLPGLFLIYATTPDFYTDPKHGIVIYGALAQRIGQPGEHSPKALDTIWNLDAIKLSLEKYQEAARKIRKLYLQAYPKEKEEDELIDEKDLDAFVEEEIYKRHSQFGSVSFWRVLVTSVVRKLDILLEGIDTPDSQIYDDIMEDLRET